MTASAIDVVDERWLLIEEDAYAGQLAGLGGVMDRMILGPVDGTSRRDGSSMRADHFSCCERLPNLFTRYLRPSALWSRRADALHPCRCRVPSSQSLIAHRESLIVESR
jgi:hypothetical protein